MNGKEVIYALLEEFHKINRLPDGNQKISQYVLVVRPYYEKTTNLAHQQKQDGQRDFECARSRASLIEF